MPSASAVWPRVRHLIAGFRCDQRGSLMAEVGIILPLFVFIILAGVEVGRFALLQQKLNRTAVSMADLVAQSETLNLTDVANLYSAARYVVRPFDLDKGAVIVSAIRRVGANAPTIDWQCTGAGVAAASSTLGSSGESATLPAGFSLGAGESAIYAEVVYDFTPLLFADLLKPRRLRHTAVFRPRFGALSALPAGSNPPANPPACSPVV